MDSIAAILSYSMLHFITRVPLVRSITHSVYEIGDWLGRYYEQLNLIDSVFLDDDMKRLEPMTAVYAPDSEWRNKKIELDNIEYILESHLFEALLWCDVLLEYAPGSGHENEGKKIESLSGAEWSITKNGLGMPCFTIFIGLGEQLASCVTECDVLARNGIVHTVDKVMLDTPVATRGPSPSLPPIERPPRDVYNNNGRPSGQTGQGSNGYLDGETDVSYSRPKRLYGWDEVDTDATSSAKRQGVVLAALLPLLLTLQ